MKDMNEKETRKREVEGYNVNTNFYALSIAVLAR
jgi:hypothetical protein